MGKSMLKFKELNETSLTFGEIVRADRAFRADLFTEHYDTFRCGADAFVCDLAIRNR